jgi:hypothetical protein
MKASLIAGIVLLLGGIVGLATGGFSFSHQHKDVDAGPIQISHEKKESVPVSPLISGIAIVCGLALTFVGVKGK